MIALPSPRFCGLLGTAWVTSGTSKRVTIYFATEYFSLGKPVEGGGRNRISALGTFLSFLKSYEHAPRALER